MRSVSLEAAIAAVAIALLVQTDALAGDLVAYTVDRTTFSIPQSLGDASGDVERGRAVAINRKKGNCLACHTLPIQEQPFHGEVGPPLNGVGARYTAAQLRLRVVDPKQLNPMSIMPSFYKVDGLERVAKKFKGKTILSGQEIEDVVAYLQTLK